MVKIKGEKLACKANGCLGHVWVDVDDTTIGNFFISKMDGTVIIKADNPIPMHKTVGEFRIIQPDFAEVKHQSFFFQRNDDGVVDETVRFYLTCDAIPSHTLPYNIVIKDGGGS